MTPDQLTSLSRWLATELGVQDQISAQRISGGQSNPTYFLTCGPRQMVLRKQPPGPLLPGAHAIDREYRVQKALGATEVPVPNLLGYCEDPSVLGTPFYLMDRVEGVVFHDTALPQLDPALRRELYLAAARTMARMHNQSPDQIGLGDYGKPGDYFARQIARWGRQLHAAQSGAPAVLLTLEKWLLENLPPEDGISAICHGDYRIGNLILSTQPPQVAAILDWELSTLGHPMADLGYFCMCWRTKEAEYGGLADRDWRALGIPEKAEFLQEYYAHSRYDARLLPFHEAFALFRFAVIWLGIADRALAGNASGGSGAEAQAHAYAFAELFGQHGLEATTA